MFPVTGLFQSITCPDWNTCKLRPCLFSHAPPPTLVRAPPTPVASTSASASRPTPAPPRADRGASNVPLKRAPVLEVAGGAAAASKVAKGSGSGPAASGSVASPANTKYESFIQPLGLPPRLTVTGSAHTDLPTRRKMLSALYTQFSVLYNALPSPLSHRLSSLHALEQESTLYSKSNKSTYRNAIISALARLKKLPPVEREEETGTLESLKKRAEEREEREKGRLSKERVEKWVASEEVLELYDYVLEVPLGTGGERKNEEGNVKKCDRCGTEWRVKGVLQESDFTVCSYHFGKLVTEKLGGVKERVYSCCPTPNAPPCQQGAHVFRDTTPLELHSRIPFVPTSSLLSVQFPSIVPLEIAALDCELIYTTSGMALARLTVVDGEGKVVLDEYVKPNGVVLDTNLRYSGITEAQLAEKAKLDLQGVREKLGELVGVKTVLVGHGLENDLKALRLVHHRVVDTAIIFPHPRGVPWRHSLRNLTRDILGKFIQDSDPSLGHSSEEDARAALELLRWKIINDKS